MPGNYEFVAAAYGIVSAVVVIYLIGVSVKLRSITSKIKRLDDGIKDETSKP